MKRKRFWTSQDPLSLLPSSLSLFTRLSLVSLCSTSVCRALCVQYLQHPQLTVAPVTSIHLWPPAHGSCLRTQHTHLPSTPLTKLSLRASLREQTEVRTLTKWQTHTVTHTLRTCNSREACVHRTRRWCTAGMPTDTHIQVWVHSVEKQTGIKKNYSTSAFL